MNWKSDKLIAIFLSSSIFVVMPFIYSLKLQDVEISLRFLTLAIFLVISSAGAIFYTLRNRPVVNWNKTILLVSVFLIVALAGLFRSLNWGDGYFEFMKLFLQSVLFFQMLILFSADRSNIFIFFKAICISAIIFISFGWVQFLPIIKKGDYSDINYALSSTLGNKNFFAETLLLMFPVCIASSLLFSSVWRWIGVLCSILILAALIVLQTLSTWVALIVASGFVLILILKFRQRLFAKKTDLERFYMALLAAVIIVIGVVFFGINRNGFSNLKSRITTFESIVKSESEDPFKANQNSTYERLFLWKNSVKMIADHPLFGCGMANWKIEMPSYGMGNAAYMTTDATRFVHPHNDFLLIASETGLFGLLVFFAFLLILMYYGYRCISLATQRDQMLLALLMLLGIVALVIVSNFSMPMSRIYPPIIFMLFAAIIVSEHQRLITNDVKISGKVIVVICVVSLTAAVAAALTGSKRLKADLLLSKALQEDRKKSYELMRQHLEKIDKAIFPLDVTATPIAWYQGYAWFYSGNLEGAFNSFKEAELVNPNHLTVLNDLGTCYNLKGDAKMATVYYKKALTIQPAYYDALINLAVIYFNQGDLEKSYATVIKVTGKIEPGSIQNIGAIILAKGRTVIKDEKQLNKLEKAVSRPIPLSKLLIELRSQNGDIQEVIKHL